MVPYTTQQYNPQQAPVHHHPVLPQPQIQTPASTVYTYSHGHGAASANQQSSYETLKSLEYNVPATVVTPLQTSVDYKGNTPLTIVSKKTLPSISTTSFQQFYSPGLEYHYTEALPITKLSPQPAYNYQHAPSHSYQNNFISQAPTYSYYHSNAQQSPMKLAYNKYQSAGFESYVPSTVTYARQHQHQYQHQHQNQNQIQSQYKNFHANQYSQHQGPQYTQQLFTPSQQSSYSSYANPHNNGYNTIQYSVPLPPYEHTKRSTSKATATLSVKAPKSN
jgi:hypothetical protein